MLDISKVNQYPPSARPDNSMDKRGHGESRDTDLPNENVVIACMICGRVFLYSVEHVSLLQQ